MKIEQGYIYHVYNQGNNRGKVFFERENYLFFLKKLWKHVVPYSDILAYCLMPNHFHLMVLVNDVKLPVKEENRRRTEGFAPSETLGSRHETIGSGNSRTINHSIGIMLRSYTNAINKQQNRSGSLFRKTTKAECINCPNGITPTFYATEFGTQIHVSNPEKEYPQACFNYIHQNPVKAGLVAKPEEWEFSSAKDYAGLRNRRLVNQKVAEKYIEL
ncbi:Transposase [Salinivirga cyanobacteriivorans]|uniref:Transposase n=1 Tax=Salinivirga cyanobacteriivorans TaxID=1307839 RepID=A0A0S2HX97_9BACT|nr:hypothetical protein [Salinivirga cyanobacteriivorans]ALO14662.1 Transposase [Salinivirga cyanobacteriivorans]